MYIRDQRNNLLAQMIIISLQPKDQVVLWFHVEAARHRPPASRPCKWWERDNSKGTGWVILKFGTYIGSSYTFQCYGSKAMVSKMLVWAIFQMFISAAIF